GLLERHEARAHTAVLVGVEGATAGVLAVADAVKPDARQAIAELRARDITPVMLTGDTERTAKAVAEQAGIEAVHAQIAPQDKAAQIRELQAQGARVAMAGDGINDAPALMQAHVGIAIGAGTDIAIESSDVVLVGERLGAVPEAITIGGLSYRKTVQNLWLAFFFNGVGVPLAAMGVVHPSWAMAAMAASVTLVLANSFGGRVLGRPARHEGRAHREAPAPEAAQAPTEEAVFAVADLHCRGCVDTVRSSLLAEHGVERVEGELSDKTIRVSFRPDAVTFEDIEAGIARLGFRVKAH
ncbi:MAG: HAD-IC family P-type ATPase, partial [Gammaproteobacteria bacterium]|nr:HAD-IC family P-type ATPase [Gammaproteobacteria bacterium]NIR82305.1 HAD-IC family P-type ATPase [Gammaproteobacteria bacterium]NIR91269.1 HAD-IC family P-type ATPase [Gammaproteobacteria bacterium]NIU03454.1 HAD-IC family P-type ATPase [Gammaproteobacteria bacterium]NIV50889.1 HAD-IC family P-type ATPase [Gammaproteobacteria bacterium]